MVQLFTHHVTIVTFKFWSCSWVSSGFWFNKRMIFNFYMIEDNSQTTKFLQIGRKIPGTKITQLYVTFCGSCSLRIHKIHTTFIPLNFLAEVLQNIPLPTQILMTLIIFLADASSQMALECVLLAILLISPSSLIDSSISPIVVPFSITALWQVAQCKQIFWWLFRGKLIKSKFIYLIHISNIEDSISDLRLSYPAMTPINNLCMYHVQISIKLSSTSIN